MLTTVNIIRRNFVFILFFIMVWIALGSAVAIYPKAELHLWLNQYHSPCLDSFFKYFTKVGEVGPYIALCCLLFYRLGSATFVIASELASGIVVQIVKHIVQAPRPKIYFDLANNPDILPIVEGVHLHSSNSFPSGHTATFTALFLSLAIIIAHRRIHIPRMALPIIHFMLFAIAIVGAYSRIYLSQHFASDVFAGGCIGLIMTIIVSRIFKYIEIKYPKFYNWKIRIRHAKDQTS